MGALYVDNQETSAPFSAESLKTAEALARHAALAIENALLFEREQRTIEELRTAQTQLLQSEKLATIGQMAAGIAHELNTPLTYIMGNLELLQAHPPASAGQKEMLGRTEWARSASRASAQRLLAFSRARPGGAGRDRRQRGRRAQPGAVPLPDPQGRRAAPQGVCSLPAVGEGVVEPASRRLLINLVVNAVHAMEGGGTLQVATAPRDGHVEIAVVDTGPGHPVEIQPTMFEPFFTTKPEGKGTGLGAVDRPHDRRAPQGTHRVHQRAGRYDLPS